MLFTVLICLALVPSQARANVEENEIPLVALVKSPGLQNDLKLSDADFQKFQRLFSKLFQLTVEMDMNASEPKPGSDPIEEISKYLNEQVGRIRKETQNVCKGLQQMLSEEQYEKFSTRVIQVYVGMPVGYVFVDLFDASKLTDDQKQKLSDHYQKHMLDRIRDQIQKLPAATARQRADDSAEEFDQFLTATQRKKMNDLCLGLMPSYVRLILFPEELTEYDSLHQSSDAVPRAMRLALKQDFLDEIRREAKLSSNESQQVLTALQKTGKIFQILYYDYQVNLHSGMQQDEALQTWIRGQAKVYTEFHRELQAFLTPEKRKLLQNRMTQMASNDLIMSCVFLCEEFAATNDNRKNAMFYEYKTIKAYRELTSNTKISPQEQQEVERKYAEYKSQCMKEFTADWSTDQQTMFVSKILQGRPNYISQINNVEDAQK